MRICRLLLQIRWALLPICRALFRIPRARTCDSLDLTIILYAGGADPHLFVMCACVCVRERERKKRRKKSCMCVCKCVRV